MLRRAAGSRARARSCGHCPPTEGTCRLVDMGTSRLVLVSRSERWWVGFRWWFRWWSSAHRPGFGGAGDAGGCGDVQGAVRVHAQDPALGEGFQAVVAAAQAA